MEAGHEGQSVPHDLPLPPAQCSAAAGVNRGVADECPRSAAGRHPGVTTQDRDRSTTVAATVRPGVAVRERSPQCASPRNSATRRLQVLLPGSSALGWGTHVTPSRIGTQAGKSPWRNRCESRTGLTTGPQVATETLHSRSWAKYGCSMTMGACCGPLTRSISSSSNSTDGATTAAGMPWPRVPPNAVGMKTPRV